MAERLTSVAVLGLVASVTYFFSGFTFVGALVSVPLGLLARGVPRSRDLGTAALVVTAAACVIAAAALATVG